MNIFLKQVRTTYTVTEWTKHRY